MDPYLYVASLVIVVGLLAAVAVIASARSGKTNVWHWFSDICSIGSLALCGLAYYSFMIWPGHPQLWGRYYVFWLLLGAGVSIAMGWFCLIRGARTRNA